MVNKRLINTGIAGGGGDRVGVFDSVGPTDTSNFTTKDMIGFTNTSGGRSQMITARSTITLSAFVYWEQLNSDSDRNASAYIFGLNNGTSFNCSIRYPDYSPANSITLNSTGGSGSVVSSVLPIGWTYVTAVFDTSSASIYLNGSLDNSGSITYGSRSYYDTIGAGLNTVNNAASLFRGKMNDVRIFSKVLNSTEISQLANEIDGSLGNDPFSDGSCDLHINFNNDTIQDETGTHTPIAYGSIGFEDR